MSCRGAKVVVDSVEQVKIGGEIHKALSTGFFREEQIYAELGEIVNGWKPGRASDEEITLMDSTGLSVHDQITFYRAYKKALMKGVGTWVKLY